MRWSIAAKIVHPPLQGEVPVAAAAATKGEGHRRPAQFAGDAIHQFGEGAAALARVEWADGEPVTQDETRKRARPAYGTGEVSRQA